MLGFSPLSSQPLAATETPDLPLPSILLTATLGVLDVSVNTTQVLPTTATLQSSIGSVTAVSTSTLPIAGIEAVASIGTVNAQASATVTIDISSQEISTSLGDVVVFNEDTILISGTSATSAVGLPDISGDANFGILGAQSATSMGTAEVYLGAVASIALGRIVARIGTASIITTENTINAETYSRLRTIYIRKLDRSNTVYVRGR